MEPEEARPEIKNTILVMELTERIEADEPEALANLRSEVFPAGEILNHRAILIVFTPPPANYYILCRIMEWVRVARHTLLVNSTLAQASAVV